MPSIDVLELLVRTATVIVATIAGVVGWRGYKQKRDADARTAWWQRMQWALDLTSTDDPNKVLLGWTLLPTILEMNPVGEDKQLATAVLDYLDGKERAADTETTSALEEGAADGDNSEET